MAMASTVSSDVIREGDQAILKREKVMKVVQIRKGRPIFVQKMKFNADEVIGEPYGSVYQLQKRKLVKAERTTTLDVDMEEESGADNRKLTPDISNQKLSKSDIQDMKKTLPGEDIVDQLIENSATFKAKTEFSKQKYIKKKKKKYTPLFTFLRPNCRLLTEMYYNRAPTKKPALEALNFPKSYCDSLYSFPLNLVTTLARSIEVNAKTVSSTRRSTSEDVCSFPSVGRGRQVLGNISDACEPPVLNATSEHTSSADMEQDSEVEADEDELQDANNSEEEVKRKRKLQDEDRARRREAREGQIQRARNVLEEANMDGLIVATKFHPTPVVLELIKYVATSRPLVVFSQYREPLLDCYVKLRDRGGMVNLRLTETWLREYQVLKDRTHPTVNMDGAGGYLLTGTVVEV